MSKKKSAPAVSLPSTVPSSSSSSSASLLDFQSPRTNNGNINGNTNGKHSHSTNDTTGKLNSTNLKSSSSSSSFLPVSLFVLLSALLIAFLNSPFSVSLLPSLTGIPSPNKAPYYSSFSNLFFPFYLSEHSNATCKLLHITGTTINLLNLLFSPLIFLSGLVSVCIGVILCKLLVGFESGIIEGMVMIGIFLFVYTSVLRKEDRKWGRVALIPIVGYGFAWVGHFVFENNKPATFTFPAYSLIGDVLMWWKVVSGQEPI